MYAHGIAKNHPFVDGNKRAALITALAFLRRNGFRLLLGEVRSLAPKHDVITWPQIMEHVASGALSRDDLVAAFTEEMGGDPLNIIEG